MVVGMRLVYVEIGAYLVGFLDLGFWLAIITFFFSLMDLEFWVVVSGGLCAWLCLVLAFSLYDFLTQTQHKHVI